jgi:hypothetical protein
VNPNTDPPTSPMRPMPGGSPPPRPGGPPGAPSGGHPVPAAHPDAQPAAQPEPAVTPPGNSGIATVILIGAAVAVALGVYGRLHEGTGFSINLAGFSSGAYAKAWLATLAAVLAVVQVLSAMVMYGKVLAHAPPWIGALHRWSGRLAVLATVPVAVHCLFALGFLSGSTRVLVHSLLGCLFYGAFVAKMLALTRPNLPAKALPVLGGIVFTGLVALWLTSAQWLFSTQGLKF